MLPAQSAEAVEHTNFISAEGYDPQSRWVSWYDTE